MKLSHPLAGEHVTLREISEEDNESVVRWRNAEQPNRVFFSDRILTFENQHQWIKTYRNDRSDFTFIIEHGGKPVGMVSLYHIEEKEAEFGRLLIGEKEFRRQGLAEEAARRVIDFGFRDLGLEKIHASVFEENRPAVTLYLSIGFEIVGEEANDDGRKVLAMSIGNRSHAPHRE
jgi:diamine N-acetyltransferase